MNEDILRALKLYIETNDESKDRIYGNKEGMAITLNTLENEGLIDFQNIDVSDGKDYVVAFLSQESGCADITTVKSWDLTNGPLYICSKGGTQNLFAVGGDATNLSNGTREAYYFRGGDPQNYVQLEGNSSVTFNILSIERDDSLVLYSSSPMSSYFTGKTQKVVANNDVLKRLSTIDFDCLPDSTAVPINKDGVVLNEGIITRTDIINSSYCTIKNYNFTDAELSESSSPNRHITKYIISLVNPFYSTNINIHYDIGFYQSDELDFPSVELDKNLSYYKINLIPCMKIISGIGSKAKPYIITPKNCS